MQIQQESLAIARNHVRIVVSLIGLTLAACHGDSEETATDGSDSSAPTSSATGAATSLPTLPGYVEDGNCGDADRPAAPDGCSWAASTDAVVWGVLRDIKLVETPAIAAWNTGTKWEWAQDCDAVNPALELIVDVQRVLSGDRSLVGTLSVKIGTRQREHLDPMPVLDKTGTLAWEKIGISKGGPLTIGQSIGLPLHYISEYAVWSLMGESPFVLDPSGRVAFQDRRGQCNEPTPVAMAGLGLDLLGRSLAACAAGAAGHARRARVQALWGTAQDPTAFMAASCFRKQVPLSAGQCVAASDCVGGQDCVAGACRGS